MTTTARGQVVARVQSAERSRTRCREPSDWFTLTGAAEDIKGFTDANGFLRARVAADVAELTLTIVGHVIKLKGGALKELDDPDFGDTRAVQERLFNLAYGPARREVWTANDVKAVINEFRKDFALPEGGAVDDGFKERLREVHGS